MPEFGLQLFALGDVLGHNQPEDNLPLVIAHRHIIIEVGLLTKRQFGAELLSFQDRPHIDLDHLHKSNRQAGGVQGLAFQHLARIPRFLHFGPVHQNEAQVVVEEDGGAFRQILHQQAVALFAQAEGGLGFAAFAQFGAGGGQRLLHLAQREEHHAQADEQEQPVGEET